MNFKCYLVLFLLLPSSDPNILMGISNEKDVGLGFFKNNFGGINCFNIIVGSVKGLQK